MALLHTLANGYDVLPAVHNGSVENSSRVSPQRHRTLARHSVPDPQLHVPTA